MNRKGVFDDPSEAQRSSPGEAYQPIQAFAQGRCIVEYYTSDGSQSTSRAVLSTLDKLAKALGVNVGDLYEVLPDEECDGSGIVRVMRGEVR